LKIITIHLNNLNGFKKTLNSINKFSEKNNLFQWLIKDGNSENEVIKCIESSINGINEANLQIAKDTGVYHAMNQSLEFINDDDWVLFLNAGDQLSQEFIREFNKHHFEDADIVFSDMLYGENQKMIVTPEKLDFAYLLGKTINHQSLIIKGKWIKKYRFNTDYTIVADWVQLFEILKNEDIIIKKLDYPICIYEGGGISEIQEEKRKMERMKYLKSVYSDWELEGLSVLSALRQRKWYDFLLKSLDSPKRGMILAGILKWMK
jgi:hypothetical protein